MVDGYLKNSKHYKMAILHEDLLNNPEEIITELFDRLCISMDNLSLVKKAFEVIITRQRKFNSWTVEIRYR